MSMQDNTICPNWGLWSLRGLKYFIYQITSFHLLHYHFWKLGLHLYF